MLTLEQLRLIMPDLPPAKGTTFLPFLEAAMAEFAIGTPARAAAFLAQIAHESGQLRFMQEIWGPTAAQGRYEPVSTLASNLGNTAAGDGRRFKGRGPIQLTGRNNYKRFGELLGIDLIAYPDRAAQPEVAFRTAALFWMKNGLNQLADQSTGEAFQLITRRINGGVNGLADRRRFYTTACRVLGVTAPPPGTMRSAPPAPPEGSFNRGAEAMWRRPRQAAGSVDAAPRAKSGRSKVRIAGLNKATGRRASSTSAGGRKGAATTSKRAAAGKATPAKGARRITSRRAPAKKATRAARSAKRR